MCADPPFLIEQSGHLVECHAGCGCKCAVGACRLRQVQSGAQPRVGVKYIDPVCGPAAICTRVSTDFIVHLAANVFDGFRASQ